MTACKSTWPNELIKSSVVGVADGEGDGHALVTTGEDEFGAGDCAKLDVAKIDIVKLPAKIGTSQCVSDVTCNCTESNIVPVMTILKMNAGDRLVRVRPR